MLASQKTIITFKIPEERSDLVFGKKSKNIRKIEEDTGAKIRINDDGTEATISGTYGQCEVAKSRIEVYLDNESKKPKPGVYPELGLTILDTSHAMLSAADIGISSGVMPKIHFRRYNLKDNNAHSRGRELFYITFNRKDSSTLGLKASEIFKEEPDYNELERVINDTEASTMDVYDLLFGTPEIILNKLKAKKTPKREVEVGNPSIWSKERNYNYGNEKSLETNRSEWEPDVLAPTSQYSFSISSQLSRCIAQVTTCISDLFPVSDSGMEIRVSAYLGRELFFNVPNESSYTLSEWCKLRRFGPKGIRTSFQHDAPLVDGLRILQTGLGFQEAESLGDSEIDKWSITIYFNDGEDKKMKLNWDYQKRSWKITKVVKSLRRIVLIDLLSGLHLPDIRFVIKTQINIPIDQKLVDMINILQNSLNRDESSMSFRVNDFAGILNVTRIEQTISKRRFYNKDYRINIVPTKQDPDGTRVTYGNNVTIKHLNWIAMNKNQMHSYENSCATTSSTSQYPQYLSSSHSSSSINSSPPTSYEQQESNMCNVVTEELEEYDLISFDDEAPMFNPLTKSSSLDIKGKMCHLLDDNSGFNQVKHILDDDSQVKTKRHILDNENELKSQRHILDDDYDLLGMKDLQAYQNDYNKHRDENFTNEELQKNEETGIKKEFVEENNWKNILEFTIPRSLEYVREFCRIIS